MKYQMNGLHIKWPTEITCKIYFVLVINKKSTQLIHYSDLTQVFKYPIQLLTKLQP